MAKIVKFPDKEYILRCRDCKTNEFYVILSSIDPYDVKGFECAECGDWFEIREKTQVELINEA